MSVSILSENLALLRADRKYTKKEIAKLIDVNWLTYKSWEDGRYVPTLPSLIKLSKVYHVTLDELAGLKKIKESNLINKDIHSQFRRYEKEEIK